MAESFCRRDPVVEAISPAVVQRQQHSMGPFRITLPSRCPRYAPWMTP
jgi:hypothetical protein